MDEDRSLKEVIEIMKNEHHFTATTRSFKRWIAAWGWRKNIKVNLAQDDGAVRAALQSRHHSTACESTQNYLRLSNGQFVSVDRLTEYLRRKKARMSGAAHHGCHLEPNISATTVPFPWGVATPDSLRVCELIFVQTVNHTQGRHSSDLRPMDLEARTRLLLQHRDCSVRWLNFVGDVEWALEQGRGDTLTQQLSRAPAALDSIIQIQPYSLLCCLYMLVLLLGENASLRNLMVSLMKYGVTVARGIGLPDSHPLIQILSSLPLVPENQIGELMHRTWGSTTHSWLGVSLEGIMDSVIAARCSQNWVDGKHKADIMVSNCTELPLPKKKKKMAESIVTTGFNAKFC